MHIFQNSVKNQWQADRGDGTKTSSCIWRAVGLVDRSFNAVQYGNHWPHVVIRHLKWGLSELLCFTFENARWIFKTSMKKECKISQFLYYVLNGNILGYIRLNTMY